ncbi:MAG: site-2 protease family protein [candidate division NC10 bacterium]|nr:site-2 protease family protein [candidate division NC10 bacterium]
MRGTVRIGTLAGIPLELHFTWAIIFALLSWSLATGYFPQAVPDLPTGSYWSKGVLAALLLFASILAHELGHALVARREGVQTRRIVLFAFGGVAELKAEPPGPGAEFRIAVAGPVVSIGLVVFFGILTGALAVRPGAAAVAAYLAMLNGIVVLFNLIPAFPLDGGRILRAALWRFWGDLPRATRAAAGAGRFFAYFLIVTGIFGMLAGHAAGALWRVFIGLFLLMAAQSAAASVWLKDALSGLHVRDLMTAEPVAVPAHIPVAEAIRDYFLRYGYGGFPVERAGRVVGLLELAQVKAVPPEERDQVSVQAVALPVEAPVRTAPGADAMEALQQMLQAGHGRLLVFEGETFRGLLTHTGVTRLIQIKMALGI